eukprot:8395747-Alexandrium_andersonii.AAC.1
MLWRVAREDTVPRACVEMGAALTASVFKDLSAHLGRRPRRNGEGRFDKEAYVAAVVETLFPERSQEARQDL